MSAHETIAKNLRNLRAQRGWSVRQLAEECGKRGMPSLTQASLTNIERQQTPTPAGRVARKVSVDELLFLAELFGLEPADLMAEPKWTVCGGCNGTGRLLANLAKGETFAVEMSRRRIAAGLTRLQLAGLAGISRQTISNIESGRHNVQPETVYVIRKALDEAEGGAS